MSTQHAPSLLAALEYMGRSGDLNQAPHLVHELEIALHRLAPALKQLRQDVAA